MMKCKISREKLYKRIYNADSSKQINPLSVENEREMKLQCSKVITSMIRSVGENIEY